MGSKLSIDKHVSNLEDILELNTKLLEKIKFDSNIPESITQHLKIWKFQEDKHPLKKVKSEPINLSTIQTSGFNFLSTECYLVLLVYKKAQEEYNQFTNFPHQMWGVVESYSNLTPRGLEEPVAASESHLESFLLPQRQQNPSTSNIYEYMIFVWNGKAANPLIKASALSNAFELENLLNRGRDPLLEILFSGGIIKNKKLSKGSILTLQSSAQTSSTTNIETENQVRETVYLFNFLFPVPEKRKEFSKLADFLAKKQNTQAYASQFIHVDLNDEQIQNSNNNKVIQKPKLNLRESLTSRDAQPRDAFKELALPRRNSNEINNKIHEISNEGSPSISKESSKPISSRSRENNRYEDTSPQQQPIANNNTFQFNLPAQIKSKVPAINIPKLDLNCKTHSQEVSIGVPLVEGVECNDNEKIKPMKLPLASLKLQRDDTTYQDIEEEDSNGFNFDIRDTDRKKLKIQHFAEQCSSVIPNFLYVGGEQIAYNKEVLKQIGVTHVVNCAGDVCKNKYPDDFFYQTYYLKDSKTENIECLFYEVISIIENAKKNNGKVLIHCVQGVSRSVSLCIAYLIISQQITYSQAFDIIKKNRGVASPNMGFTVQLLLFQKRLQASYDSIPIAPRVFAVGRGVSGPQSIACRMLMDQLYSGKVLRTFDSRGVFLVLSEHDLYLWIGPECNKTEKFIQYALDYTKFLKQFEKAPNIQPILMEAENESEMFWGLWGIVGKPGVICQKIREWDQWYEEVDENEFNKEKESNIQLYSSDRVEEVHVEKKAFYIYPNSDDYLLMFDLEDLDQSQLCILIKEINKQVLQVYVWRGQEWVGNDDDEQYFVHEIISKNYQYISERNIYVFQEEPNEESDVFLDCFS
ncbi:unnamed protein product (macronuclear) [Paramecium tetraurelia]|uniref:Protein-serine/threonine phosphatase n=1 Tax=Paramecium tetraurelia TaxID=5888 RepID=A0BYK5_PARTE|nr:uncharacterized protein GSPATT00033475001 [Paramecium tetraurelia]CAK63622.1 unnamed protein product [Paramecium tetraurelia]|eukprot:XP_001431020.1 hypothetical protein (macronuclear) [Paramecium tetraurelia strain d4-2]